MRIACAAGGIRITRSTGYGEYGALWHFAVPAAIAGIVGQVGIWSSNALVVRGNNGFSELAAFNAANMIRQLILFTPTILSRVAFPVLCKLHGTRSATEYSESFRLNLRLTAFVAIAVALPLIFLAPVLLSGFRRAFRENGNVLVLLSIAAVLEVLAWAFYQTLIAFGKVWWHVSIMVGWSSCLIIMTKSGAGFGSALALSGAYVLAWAGSLTAYAVLATRLHRRTAVQRAI